MLKRYSEYSGCNTTISCIAKECPDGEWVRFDDLIKLIGCNDPQRTEYNKDYAAAQRVLDEWTNDKDTTLDFDLWLEERHNSED